MVKQLKKNSFGNAKFEVRAFVAELKELVLSLPSPVENVKVRSRRMLLADLETIVDRLDRFRNELDTIPQPKHVFDPTDPSTVGRLIAQRLLEQDRVPFSSLSKFYGSGVYAIYYCGDFLAYEPVRGSETPLYVGKVDPEIPTANSPRDQGTRLWTRLNDHLNSIEKARNLDTADFTCRHLVVKSAWQNMAETYLIDLFKPVWNKESRVCFGIGKHGDLPRKRSNTRSPWDTLHPGRDWAWREGNVANPKTKARILADIAKHFENNPPRSRKPKRFLTQI